MGLLGNEDDGKAVKNLSGRVEQVESHMEALDNALQDLKQEVESQDRGMAEKNRERLKDVEELMLKLTEIQESNFREMETEEARELSLEKRVEAVDKKLKRIRQNQEEVESVLEALKDRIEEVEQKVFEVEDEATQMAELNEGRIKSRVRKSDHKEDIELLMEEISRLKTSVSVLADEFDEDAIVIE